MPNHTANKVVVTGPTDDVNRFLAKAKGQDESLSFNSLFPMPDEIRNTSSPTKIMTQEEIDMIWMGWNKRKELNELNNFEKDKPIDLGITKQTSDRLLDAYGVNNWYDWALEFWGTKWDCYEVGEWSTDVNNDKTEASIYYETAWSPATNLWVNVSNDFPTLKFFHEFADEGGAFVGNETIFDGDIQEINDYEWNSTAANDTLKNLGRYFDEEEQNEE